MRPPERNRLLAGLTIIGALVGIGGYLVEGRPAGTNRYYLVNSGGSVVFEHKSHLLSTDGCENCHHDLLSSDMSNECSDCHGEDFAADDFDHADLKGISAHTCRTCHEIKDTRDALSCRKCHPSVQESEELTIACIQCHDADYTPDILTHGEMKDIHTGDCSRCHTARSISAAYHQACSECHLAGNSSQFADGDGNVRCERCHLK